MGNRLYAFAGVSQIPFATEKTTQSEKKSKSSNLLNYLQVASIVTSQLQIHCYQDG